MIVEIECLANPPGTESNPYEHIEAAIRVIQESGLKYEVGALGSTVEGEPDELWPLVRRVHEACLKAGARGLVSVIKVEQTRDDVAQPTIEGLTGKFRS
ncbi:MAG: MTH1187 family thiamine-binding protein [Hyphomicrobiales bacterium]